MKPFEGIRILDCTHVLAGPFCTYQLAWLGAEVIRLESTADSDFIRSLSPDPQLAEAGMGDTFLCQNAGKHSVAVNLKTPAGQKIYRQLAATADVVIENFRPGVMEKMNCGYDTLVAENPGLIYCSVTGFGQEGPMSGRPAYDHLIQAISGIMAANGTEQTGPTRVGFPIVDYLVGLLAAFAISSAIAGRARGGEGQKIDVAMLDAALIIMMPLVSTWLISNHLPANTGRAAFSGSPFSGTFAARDGQVAVVANTPQQAGRLAAALGRPELSDEGELAAWRNDAELFSRVQTQLVEIFSTRTVAEWEELLQKADVPAGRVNTVAEIIASPQIQGRGLFHTLQVPTLGREITIPGVGFNAGPPPSQPPAPPPQKGSHTAHYLQTLGYGAEQIAAFEQEGVVACAKG